tara:strand:+ start:439 stop:882 length:444 start_codon:yes stop_codon:yes gene_type:complete
MDNIPLHPTINAGLNALAGLLLVVGLHLIRKGKESAHKKAMMAAFGCSAIFLASYLSYHFSNKLIVKYAGPEWGAIPYLALLISHSTLAALVPFMAIRTIWLGIQDRRPEHRKWARRTFPIWIYVSVTGVLVWLVLYVLTDSGISSS